MIDFNIKDIIKYYENIYAVYMKQKYHINKNDNMENLLVKFPKQMIQKMNEIVNTGKYGSRSELIRESLRVRLQEIEKNQAIAAGVSQ
jgi:hypothetical protein